MNTDEVASCLSMRRWKKRYRNVLERTERKIIYFIWIRLGTLMWDTGQDNGYSGRIIVVFLCPGRQIPFPD
jgi:hypothetical protein